MIFGNWINELDKLNNEYKTAKPFEHVVIENFLMNNIAKY